MEANSSSSAVCGVVVDHVIDQVAKKVYNVGDKLPPERDMAKEMGVSRAAVREAIKVLNYLGFVDSNQGSGNYITDTYDRTSANMMKVMFLRGDVDFHGFTIFRQMLELQAFDLALEHATESQKREMEQIVNLMDVTPDNELLFGLDSRLHSLLAEASHNELIVINFNALSSAIGDYMNSTYNQTVSKKKMGFEQLQEYHHAIVAALNNGDKEAGRRAIIDHFSWLY